MKTIISILCLMTLVSCETNIVDRYDCESVNQELLSETFIKCIEAENTDQAKESIKRAPVAACEEHTRKLLCKPIYKKIQ